MPGHTSSGKSHCLIGSARAAGDTVSAEERTCTDALQLPGPIPRVTWHSARNWPQSVVTHSSARSGISSNGATGATLQTADGGAAGPAHGGAPVYGDVSAVPELFRGRGGVQVGGGVAGGQVHAVPVHEGLIGTRSCRQKGAILGSDEQLTHACDER